MSSAVVVAYIPALHEGYHRFLATHGADGRVYVVGRELHDDYRPLAKDIRALDPALVAQAIAAWGIAREVRVLDRAAALTLAGEAPELVLPAEDVSYRLVERFFARCPVLYDTVFLRWDAHRSAQLTVPQAARHLKLAALSAPGAQRADARRLRELVARAGAEASRSADWWRQVGAAILLADGRVLCAHNEHLPGPQSPYVAGDPRANFHRGVHVELSTAVHAEAALVARAAREGLGTAGALLYVTDFPCPPCAKLIAGAGIAELCFSRGYSLLDGVDVLAHAGVELTQIELPA